MNVPAVAVLSPLKSNTQTTAFAFDVLKDDYIIKLFELNEENIDDFAQSIETIKSFNSDSDKRTTFFIRFGFFNKYTIFV